MTVKNRILAVLPLLLVTILPGRMAAQFEGGVKDSLRILCVRYGDCSSDVDGVLSVSAIMECDSLKMPTYMVGDSIVTFFSDIRAENIKAISLLYGKSLPKKLQKTFPNGLISITLKDGQDYNTSQVLPEGDNLNRKAFVTRMALSDLANGQLFASKAAELVDNYGTDDIPFRNYKYFNSNRTTPILAIDSLNRKAFIRNFSDLKPDSIGDMAVYDSEQAQEIVGDRGVNGLVIVEINTRFTLQQALVSPMEKAAILLKEMFGVNFSSMMQREVIYTK